MLYFDTLFQNIVCQQAQKTAIVYLRDSGEHTHLTYHFLNEAAERIGKALRQTGIQAGDRVAIAAPSSPFAILAGVALACMHCTAVLIDATLPPVEIEKLLAEADVSAAFFDESVAASVSPEALRDIPVFAVDDTAAYPLLPVGARRARACRRNDQDEELIAIIFSSGTTDKMKGICIPHATVTHSLDIYRQLTGVTANDKYLLVLPFNHIAGFSNALQYLLLGCELDMLEGGSTSRLAQAFLDFQPTFFALVPRVFEIIRQRILAEAAAQGRQRAFLALLSVSRFFRKRLHWNLGPLLFRRVRAQTFGANMTGLGVGATPCKQETADFFLALGYHWANFYSSTETGVPAVATGIRDNYPDDTVGNVNQFKDISVKLRNPDADGVGEILIRSPLGMKGYFRAPELTRRTIDADGYIATGDLGRIDAKGFLHVTARQKECILLHNGKKIAPFDIEALYKKQLGESVELVCCGVANPKTGCDDLHLFLEGDASALTDTLQHLRQISSMMPTTYQIAAFHVVEHLPRTSIGKIKRLALKQSAAVAAAPAAQPEQGRRSVWDILRSVTHQPVVEEPALRLREDLQLDSLNLFELFVLIQESWHIDLSGRLGELNTVSDLISLLTRAEVSASEPAHAQPAKDYPEYRSEKELRALRRAMRLSDKLWSFQVRGLENVPQNENYILAPNHETHLDGFWILSCLTAHSLDPRRFCCLAKQEHLEHRISKNLMKKLGGIPVDRSGNTAPAIARAEACLQSGMVLLLHPEGTRTANGRLGAFKSGAALLAKRTGKCIVPVCLDGAYEVFPRSRALPRLFRWRSFRRYEIRITFCPPVAPEGSVDAITQKVRAEIAAAKDAGQPA